MTKIRRKKMAGLFVWPMVVIIFFIAVSNAARPAEVLQKYRVAYGVYDLKKKKLKLVPVVTGRQSGEPLESLIDANIVVAAISGTYFDEKYRPLGDIVHNGKLIRKGHQRQAIGIKKSGEIVFRQRGANGKIDWTGIDSGIACGPRLLKNGKLDIDCKRDGFGSAANRIVARRCAIGKDKKGRLILCSVQESVNLNTLARIMQQLGAVDAINLDGGRASFFYDKGKYTHITRSPLSNILTLQNADCSSTQQTDGHCRLFIVFKIRSD